MSQVIITTTENGVGRITLARPDALHALNEDMCNSILQALIAWADDPDVKLVLVDHVEGSRGFCAGGDIRMLASSGAKDSVEARAFFATEYRMNVAPETGIGLFPDVGGGWFLPRLRGQLGCWLGLTGARLKGSDVVAAGVGTHYVPSELIANLKTKIFSADYSVDADEMIGEILREASHAVPAGSFEADMETINACFAFDTAEEIVAALKADGGEWAIKQVETLASKSPRTIKVALRQIREGARFTRFEDNMANEYRIGARQVQSADFIEGVRAIIIDKDHAPKWNPAKLEEISEDIIESIFAPLPSDEELIF